MSFSENTRIGEFSDEEVRELYEVVDKSKQDLRNARIAVGVIMILSLAVFFSNIFSSNSEPEEPSLTETLEQNTLLTELREQNSFLRNELTTRQDDIRNERNNFESQLNSKDQEINALQDQVRELQNLLVNQASNSQIQEDASSEDLEDEVLSLTQQVDEKQRENESLSTDLNVLRDQVDQLLNNANDSSAERVLEEVARLRSIVEDSEPANTVDVSTEQVLEEIARLRSTIEDNETSDTTEISSEQVLEEIARLRSTLEESDIVTEEPQAPGLTEIQIQFRDRFATFVPILTELHKEVLQIELNNRNEMSTFTLDKLTTFKANTGWLMGAQINAVYKATLRDLWSLPEVLDTINVLSDNQGYLAPGVYLSDIRSKIVDLQNRPYETRLLLASITIFSDGVETTPTSRQAPSYPERLQDRGISGVVDIDFAIDRVGSVVEETINVTAGPRQLEESAIEALTQFEYFVNPVPDYILRSVSAEVLQKIRLFGFNYSFKFELDN